MKRFGVRYSILVVIIAIFTAVVILTQHRRVSSKTTIDISQIPLNVGEWTGREIAIDKSVKDILETEAVLMRQYNNTNEDVVVLAIVYYKDSRVALHLPESCLMGQGSRLVETKAIKVELPDGKHFLANQLITKSNRENNLVIYFFETGNFRTNNFFLFRKQMLFNKLQGKSSSGALVRVSINIKNDNFNLKSKALKKFIEEIGKILPKHLI